MGWAPGAGAGLRACLQGEGGEPDGLPSASSVKPHPRPRPRQPAGVFGYARHPMYGGLVLLALGCSLVSGDELRLLLCLPFFLVLDKKVGKGRVEGLG